MDWREQKVYQQQIITWERKYVKDRGHFIIKKLFGQD
jgi:hypothetical protein